MPTQLSSEYFQEAYLIPDELMESAGWSLMERLFPSAGNGAGDKRIDEAILAAWPKTVRLTVSMLGGVNIWCHPHPPPIDWNSDFPSSADIAHAVRVLEAVGIVRAESCENEIARMRSTQRSGEAIAMILARLEADQRSFEAVADALRTHRDSQPSGLGLHDYQRRAAEHVGEWMNPCRERDGHRKGS